MISYQTIADKSYFCCLCFAIITAIAAPISTVVTSIGCIAMLVTWLLSGKALKTLKISYSQPAGKMILVFFAWLLVGTLYADNNWGDKLGTISSWKKLAYTFILLGLFYQQEWKQRFIKAYLFIMIPAAVAAVILWLLDIEIRDGARWGAGIFMSNYAAQSMAFIAATVLCIFLLKDATSRPKQYLFSIAIVLLVFNIFFVSSGRSGYFALPFAVIFAIGNIYGYRKLPYIAVIVSVLLIALVFSSNILQQRVKKGVEELSHYQDSPHLSSIGIRAVFAKNTVALIKEKPILGYGTSSFKSVYSPYAASLSQGWQATSTSDPHNIYLYIGLENGIVGLLIFLGYIYIAIRQGRQQPFYGMMAASFLVAICASSLFNSHFKTFPEGHLLAFFTGILLAQYKKETPLKIS
ncbi:MAG: O-antigen ligase family protein [Methylococcaceae bacterium]|nr:O-antigen ligase family protein [Methylococcaceae bacterium]